MAENQEDIIQSTRMLLKDLDTNQQTEIAAQLFLEYCVYQDQCENTRRLAPLINTVAEALTRNVADEESLRTGIQAVQAYLRTPPVEYYGETLARLGFLDQESVEEMLQIQPKEKFFGTFLMEQGLISQEQRDIAMMAQKRLFTVQEVHERILSKHDGGTDTTLAESLRGVFQHFLTSTSDIEDDLKQAQPENILYTLERLEDIIAETEKQSHSVLSIVDEGLELIENATEKVEAAKTCACSADPVLMEYFNSLSTNMDRLAALTMEINSSQQIQDRIGQQMLKVIPSIKIFHDQLLKIAAKLNLNWSHIEPSTAPTKVGYGGKEERIHQGDVDDLLSSLGL